MRRKEKDRQHNGQAKPKNNRKRTNNYPQNTTENKRLSITYHTKSRDKLGCSLMASRSCSTSGIHRVSPVKNQVECHQWGKGDMVNATKGTYSCINL